jgi:hypothetical protein
MQVKGYLPSLPFFHNYILTIHPVPDTVLHVTCAPFPGHGPGADTTAGKKGLALTLGPSCICFIIRLLQDSTWIKAPQLKNTF